MYYSTCQFVKLLLQRRQDPNSGRGGRFCQIRCQFSCWNVGNLKGPDQLLPIYQQILYLPKQHISLAQPLPYSPLIPLNSSFPYLDPIHSVNNCNAIPSKHQLTYIQQFYFMTSPSQLFSCVDSKAIHSSPVNNSPSKQHWSFSKDSRFKRPKYYCDSFYQIPGVKENKNRMAAFGYGKQNDLEFDKNPHQVTPSPDTYNIASMAQTNKSHKKGFTPRMSRQEIAPMSYIDLQQRKVPGPGRYEQYRYNQSPRWSLHQRVSQEIFPKTTVKIVPGPGTYINQEAIENRANGHYRLSNHRSSKSKVWNPPRSKRFNKSTTDVPGPGNYTPKNDLSNEGKYIMSKNVSFGQRKFLDGRRLSFTDLSAKRSFTPGPGSYRSPSQFGQYDQVRKTPMSNSSMSASMGASMSDKDKLKNTSAGTDRIRKTNNPSQDS